MIFGIEGAMKNEYIKSCSQATLLNTHMMFRTVRLRSFKHKSFLHSMAIFFYEKTYWHILRYFPKDIASS